MPAFVEGLSLIRPQAVSVVKEEPIVGNQPPTQLVVAVIGTADGGTPRSFQALYSYAQARDVLRSGQLLDLLRRVYGPARGAQGAYKVLAYRVNAATQATSAIKDTSAANAVTLASRDYGTHCNLVRWKLEAGTQASTYKISVQGYNGSSALVRDNLTREMLSIQYTGAGTAATLTISATQFSTSVTDAAADNVTLDFSSYTTLQQLADALIATGKYSVTIKADPRLRSATLDEITAQDIRTAAYIVRANVAAVIDWLNNEEPYIVATRVSGKALQTSSSWQGLTGGTNGAAVTTTDYQNALTALQAEACQIVIVGSEDAAVHTMADAHCHYMSQVGGNNERVAIVGGSATDTVDTTIARARALNSSRTALCYPGLIDTDEAGSPVTLSPIYTAAAVAGLHAGADLGEPSTRKPIACLGPSTRLSPSQQDQLLLGGVLPIEQHTDEGARVVQSITTYNPGQSSRTNLIARELSCRLAADAVVALVRGRLETLIGTAGGPLLKEQARSLAESALKDAQTAGLIVGDTTTPAFRDLGVTVRGEMIAVAFAASLAAPGNYVVLQASLSPYNG